MLAAAYSEWLSKNEPSEESRGAVVLGLLRVMAERAERTLPSNLRLLALASQGSGSTLAVQPEALLLSASDDGSARESVLDQRLHSAQLLGEVLDSLHGVESTGRRSGEASLRRSSGSYFTPRPVARSLVLESLTTPHLLQARQARSVSICDPAMGGGAFLLEAVAGLVRLELAEGRRLDDALTFVGHSVFGYDQSTLAVATAEAALWLLTGLSDWRARLRVADSLAEVEVPPGGFDWLIGNPPWVAFQGRAAQVLAPERRTWLKRSYSAFAGYPTLHGVFAERATQLAPRGLISLLLPSSVSDLDGYRAARAAVLGSHLPHEPLLEYGQDAFAGVVQPCFGLLASPRTGPSEPDPGRPWRLRERSHRDLNIEVLELPQELQRLAERPTLPSACFGELGLQSNRRVTSELFLRAREAEEPFVVPLLEGRNVRAFQVSPPALFMNADPRVLAESRCRFRPLADYERVGFVVRQTAAVTIAARHVGLRFRNSLLAGYAKDDLDVDLLVGLLNSTLFRAFHASRQRDARQATFPQVKVAHLRRLPAPPASQSGRARVREASAALSAAGPSRAGLAALDAAVFELFGISSSGRDEIVRYFASRFPERRADESGRHLR